MNRLETKVKQQVKKTVWYYVVFAICWIIGNRSLVNTYINGNKVKRLTLNDLFSK